MLHFVVVTLFPDEVKQFFLKGLFKTAHDKGRFSFSVVNLRTFGRGVRKNVDGYPYGGKQGMLLRSDVLYDAITSISDFEQYHVLSPSPKGEVLNPQSLDCYVAKSMKGFILIPGYYEGIDARLFSMLSIQLFSVGAFILSSGELPALLFCDGVIRRLPGVLGNVLATEEESYEYGLLEHPQYTNPRIVCNFAVPDVLFSGHHQRVSDWKSKMALKETLYHQPDLLSGIELSRSQSYQLRALFEEE